MPMREPRFNDEKLAMSPPSMKPWKMSPPSMSPLHMSPPNMLLPNFSPPTFKLPTLSASRYFPPESLFEETLDAPPSIARFSLEDPTVCVIGAFGKDTKGTPFNPAAAARDEGRIYLCRVTDVEGEVRGDAAFPPDEPRKKIVPDLKIVNSVKTPGSVLDICWSPFEGDLLLASTASGQLLILQVTTGRSSRIELLSKHKLGQEQAIITCLTASPTDQDVFAAGFSDGSVLFFQLPEDVEVDNTIKTLRDFQPHGPGSPLLAINMSADGKELFVSDNNAKVSCWSMDRRNRYKPSQKWVDDSTFADGDAVTCLISWPTDRSPKNTAPRRRPLLLAGCDDGMLRVTDRSESQVNPPPLVQEADIFDQTENEKEGGIWDLALLPPIPKATKLDDVEVGVFTVDAYPNIATDPDENGVLASCLDAGARVFVQREEFMDVFIRDPEETKFKDEDELDEEKGIEKDWFDRERQFHWYNVAELKEHKGKVCSSSAVAFIDWHPIFKEGGKQRKRRGWRLLTTSFEDRKINIWQVYAD